MTSEYLWNTTRHEIETDFLAGFSLHPLSECFPNAEC